MSAFGPNVTKPRIDVCGRLGLAGNTPASTSLAITYPCFFSGINCSSGAGVLISVYRATAATSAPIWTTVATTYTQSMPNAAIYSSAGLFVIGATSAFDITVFGGPAA